MFMIYTYGSSDS